MAGRCAAPLACMPAPHSWWGAELGGQPSWERAGVVGPNPCAVASGALAGPLLSHRSSHPYQLHAGKRARSRLGRAGPLPAASGVESQSGAAVAAPNLLVKLGMLSSAARGQLGPEWLGRRCCCARCPPPSPRLGSCCCPTDLAHLPGAGAPEKLCSHTARVDESRQGVRDQGLLPVFWWPGWRARLSRSLCLAAVQWPEAALRAEAPTT